MAMSGNSLWWLGVSLEVVSTASGTVGKQLIRYSELCKYSNPKMSKTSFYVGLFVNTICGPAIDMAAYSFAPQSLIAPFGGLDVVWNALSAPYLLQETLTRRRLLGCVLICVGTATAGAVGSHTDAVYTVEYLEELLIAPRIPIYFGFFFIWVLVNVCCLQKRPKGNVLRGVSLGVTAGTIAGNMFCVKAAVEIIQFSIDEDTGDPWKTWMPYAMLIGAVFFAVSNVKFMTQGLQEYEALFMVTVYEGSMIVSGCVSGSIVLLDLRGLEAWRIAAYWLAVLIIVLGMVVVFSEEMKNKSSLAAGTASIEPESLKEIQRGTPLSILSTPLSGVGSAGIHTDCTTPKAPGSPSSKRSGSLSLANHSGNSPISLSILSPSREKSGGSPFFSDEPYSADGSPLEGEKGSPQKPLGRGMDEREEDENPTSPLSAGRL